MIIIAVIVLIVILFVLMKYTKVLDSVVPSQIMDMVKTKSGFIQLKPIDPVDSYNATCTKLADLVVSTIVRYSPVAIDKEKVHANLYDLYKSAWKMEPQSTIEPLKAVIKSSVTTYGPEIMAAVDINVIPLVEQTLMYEIHDRYGLPLPSGPSSGDEIKPDEPSLHYYTDKSVYNRLITSKDNRVLQEIQSVNANSGSGNTGNMNSNLILSNFQSYNLPPGTGKRIPYDIRGMDTGLLKKLSMENTTKDPNSLQRSGIYNVRDIIETSRGVGNDKEMDQIQQDYMNRTGDKQWLTFQEMKKRNYDPSINPQVIQAKNTTNQIISMIKERTA